MWCGVGEGGLLVVRKVCDRVCVVWCGRGRLTGGKEGAAVTVGDTITGTAG